MIAFFLKKYKWRTLLLYSAQIIDGFLEALSLAVLLPLFSIIVKEETTSDTKLYKSVQSIFEVAGVDVTLGNVSLLIVVIFALKAVVKYGIMRYISYLFAYIVLDLRKTLLDALLYSRWSFYTHRPVGHFLNAMFPEAQRCGGIYKNIGSLVAALLQMAALLVISMMLSWKITFISILCGLVIWCALYHYIRITGKTGAQQKDIIKQINAQIGDLLQHLKPLKAMHAEGAVFKKVKNDIEKLYQFSFRQLMAKESMIIFREFFLIVMITSGLYFTFTYTKITSAELFVMAAIFYRLMTTAGQAQQSYQTFVGQKSFFYSFQEFMNEALLNRENCQIGSEGILSKSLDFKNITFSYDEKTVLNSISFSIPANKMIALTGPSGSGKTTILDLICKLYLPQSGKITIDDISFEDVDSYKWRKSIGYVPQEFVVLHDTIFNNIALNDPSITKDDAISALKKAKAWEFVEDLPEGLDTVLGERGSRISGGQRQRISLARALARKPQILIMDEATASLDSATEKEIFAVLKKLSKDTTIIAISHQNNLQKFADVVIDLQAINSKKP